MSTDISAAGPGVLPLEPLDEFGLPPLPADFQPSPPLPPLELPEWATQEPAPAPAPAQVEARQQPQVNPADRVGPAIFQGGPQNDVLEISASDLFSSDPTQVSLRYNGADDMLPTWLGGGDRLTIHRRPDDPELVAHGGKLFTVGDDGNLRYLPGVVGWEKIDIVTHPYEQGGPGVLATGQ